MLERDAPYVQIIEHYRNEIREGRLKDGDMLPAGREIAATFGVSLATAAKVAGGLQALGLVQPRPGAGTVVTAGRPPADRAKGGPIIIALASRSPMRPGDKAHVPDAEVVQAPQAVAAQLGAGPLAQVIRRRQVVTRDGATAAVLTSWFPAALAEAVPALLDKTRIDGEIDGYEPAWGEDWVSARPPTSAEARAFEIKRGSPVTVVHSRRFAADDSVIEYSELISRADTRLTYRYQYVPAPVAPMSSSSPSPKATSARMTAKLPEPPGRDLRQGAGAVAARRWRSKRPGALSTRTSTPEAFLQAIFAWYPAICHGYVKP